MLRRPATRTTLIVAPIVTAMNRGGILQRMRTAGLLVALFALTFKALLPPGFMLDVGAERIAITLCGGGDVYFDPLTGETSHDKGGAPANEAGQHCPFAFASAPILAAPSHVQQTPRPVFIADAKPAQEIAGEFDATGPPLPARGPPLHA